MFVALKDSFILDSEFENVNSFDFLYSQVNKDYIPPAELNFSAISPRDLQVALGYRDSNYSTDYGEPKDSRDDSDENLVENESEPNDDDPLAPYRNQEPVQEPENESMTAYRDRLRDILDFKLNASL
jgi:hypothetical protein